MRRCALTMVYSAGNCPVCMDSGALLFVVSLSSNELLVFCPSCGVAWSHPDQARQVDTVYSIGQLAPRGFRIAALSEIKRAGLEERVTATHGDNEWPIEPGDPS